MIGKTRTFLWHMLHPARVPGDRWTRLLRYALVGSAGYVTDTSTLYALMGLGLDPYRGRALSFLVGVMTTWLGNRYYTFPDRAAETKVLREWGRFFAVSAPTAILNYAIYAFLIATVPIATRHPALAVAAATLVSFSFNYLGSSLFAFRDGS